MAIDPFLEGLPAPTVIERLSVEQIIAEMKADIAQQHPDIGPVLALNSSAVVKTINAAAYREFLLRARVNDAAVSNLLAFATAGDLDHVGAGSSPPVLRMFGEDDDRFRSRILLAARSRNAGSEARYPLVAMETNIRVKAAIPYRNPANPRDPTIYVAILSTDPGGAADAALIEAVRVALNRPENRLLNSGVVVVSAVTTVVNIVATLTLTSGTPPSITTAIEASLRAAWEAEGGLGRDMTRAWIEARLLVPGVYSVAVTAPASNVIKPPFEAASIGTVALTVAGEND